MTNQQHPITPSLEQVHQWADMLSARSDHAVFSLAAQWGSDQELEACCQVVNHWLGPWHEGFKLPIMLRAARRPKPPSLKEQALAMLDDCAHHLDGAHENTIRRALEQLND
jgi:hypothetical protein